jgi:hypothetical protein
MGVPITNIANSMQLASVMEGVHTVDVGMLVMPVVMEMMMLLGDSAGIDYETGLDNPNKNKARPTKILKVTQAFQKKLKEVDIDMDVDEDKEEEVKEESGGLMARRK